jgi:hypothetical protein
VSRNIRIESNRIVSNLGLPASLAHWCETNVRHAHSDETDDIDVRLDSQANPYFRRLHRIMSSKPTKSCCTLPRLFALFLFLGGIACLVYFLTPLGSLAQTYIDDSFGNNNETETDTTNGTPTDDTPPTAAPTAIESYEFFQCDETTDLSTCCNSLDGLCEFRINEILWPLSHNSMAALNSGFLLFPNHVYELEESIDAGYRGLDLEVCNCGGSYTLCHGECGLGRRDIVEVFQYIIDFLQNNPTETVLLTLELNSDADQAVVLNDFAGLVSANVPGFEERLHVQDDISQPWPTLGDLKSTGKVSFVDYGRFFVMCIHLCHFLSSHRPSLARLSFCSTIEAPIVHRRTVPLDFIICTRAWWKHPLTIVLRRIYWIRLPLVLWIVGTAALVRSF